MARHTRAVIPVAVTSKTGSWIHPSVDLVLNQVISSVGCQVAIRPVPVSGAWFEFSIRSVTIHAERISMAAVAEVLPLRGVVAMPEQEGIGMMKAVEGLQGSGEAVVVAF